LTLNFCILASGSSGNCSVIWTEKIAVLVDCGCSSRYIIKNLNNLGILPITLKAVVITHAHTDHINISSLSFLYKYNISIYIHKDIFVDLVKKYDIKIEKHINLFCGDFNIEDIFVKTFNVYHMDKSISCTLGFTFSTVVNTRQYKIGYITDTGRICNKIVSKLVNSNILVIESNYNNIMLDLSSRPYDNKKWILSDWGHLSNEDAANAICKIKELSTHKDSLKYVFLAHISNNHNTHELAIQTTKKMLMNRNISKVKIFITKRNRKCSIIRMN
jgi:phosphoribosyl 1,2-cyclic phosphodiesterase